MNGYLKWLFFRRGLFLELRALINRWPGKITIGKNVSIGCHSLLDRYMGGNIMISHGVVVCQYCKIATCGGDIFIGSNSALGDYTTITAQGGVNIGKDVLFADHISLIANEHNYDNINTPIKNQGSHVMPITIGDGSWIGTNATILAGTQIGKNSVIAAGAVVKGRFPDYCVLGGVPAHIIKKFNCEEFVWEKL